MGLNINIEGTPTDYSSVELSNDDGNITFELSSPETDVRFSFPFPFPITEKVPDKNTSKVFIFKNEHFKTNDLLEFRANMKITIKENDGLIGYFFRSQLLLEESGHETFEQAKFSIIYALTGIEVILKNKVGTISLPPKTIKLEDIDSDLDISNLYDEDVIILVINQKLLKDPDKFDIDKYLCGLYQYGFYLLTEHGAKINYSKLYLIKNNYEKASKQSPRKFIKVKTSSSLIDVDNSKSYYHILLHQLIKQKSEFITFYQVIELLKDRVLHNEMIELKTYTTGYEVEQAVKELSKTLTLLKKLFGSGYSNLTQQIVDDLKDDLATFVNKVYPPSSGKKESDTNKLINELREVLGKHIGRTKNNRRTLLHDDISLKLNEFENMDSSDHFAALLYKFRNTMVHNYSKVIQEGVDDTLINNILMRFEYLIIELIQTYQN